jgi:hypothetical protein
MDQQKFRVIVFFYNRYETSTTSKILDEYGIKHTVICHKEEDIEKFVAGGTVKRENIIATGNGKGLALQRNSALDMMEDGEWALWLVDDLMNIKRFDDYYTNTSGYFGFKDTKATQKKYGKSFNKIDPIEFLKLCDHTVQEAERRGYALAGFAKIDNPVFNQKKYQTWGLNDGRAWMVKKTDIRFDTAVNNIDDQAWSLENTRRFGGHLINQWVVPNCKRYTGGGLGTESERMFTRSKEIVHLLYKYPTLCAPKLNKVNGVRFIRPKQ